MESLCVSALKKYRSLHALLSLYFFSYFFNITTILPLYQNNQEGFIYPVAFRSLPSKVTILH